MPHAIRTAPLALALVVICAASCPVTAQPPGAYQEAQKLEKAGEYARALAVIKGALKHSPNNEGLLVYAAYLANRAEDYAEGVVLAERAAKANPKSVAAQYQLAMNAAAAHDAPKARDALRKVIEADDPNYNPKWCRGVLDTLVERRCEVTWTYDPAKLTLKDGYAPVFAPPLDGTGQKGTIEVTGAAEHKTANVDGTPILLVKPLDNKPFRVTVRPTLSPAAYDSQLRAAWGQPDLPADARAFLKASDDCDPDAAAVRKVADAVKGKTIQATLRGATGWVDKNIKYEIVQPVPAEAVIAAGKGECGARAKVFVATMRSLGVPARRVWGYIPLPMDQGKLTEAWLEHLRSNGADPEVLRAKSIWCTHAWAEVYVPKHGWVMLDPALPSSVGLLPTTYFKIAHHPAADRDGYFAAAWGNIAGHGWAVPFREIDSKKK